MMKAFLLFFIYLNWFSCFSIFGQFSSEFKNNTLILKNDRKNLVFKGNPNTFHKSSSKNLSSKAEAVLYSNGFDVKVEILNSGSFISDLGILRVGPFFLDTSIVLKNFNTHDYTINTTDHHYVAKNKKGFESSVGGQFYPFGYSPVQIISDSKYTIAFSVQYPVLQYTDVIYHDMRAFVVKDKGEWYFTIFLNRNWYPDKKTEFFYHSPKYGGLKKEEKKTFVVSARIMENNIGCHNWINLLQPYKDYFQRMYGGVNYVSHEQATGYFVPINYDKSTPQNPYGFIDALDEYKNLRPDIHGWANWSKAIIGMSKKYNLPRYMLWSPTGGYHINKKLNFPENFTKHWLEGDKKTFKKSYGHKMQDAVSELKKISKSGIGFGLYWGYSATVQPYWDSTFSVTFDIHNPFHRQHKLEQLELASASGATEIGLDVFPHPLMLKDAINWIDTMKKYYPKIHFISEQGTSDILHSKVGFMYYPPGLRGQRHMLADFLLPGHDTRIITNSNWREFYNKGFSVFTARFDKSISTLHKRNVLGLDDGKSLLIEYSSAVLSNEIGKVVLKVNNAKSNSIRWNNGARSHRIIVTKPGIYTVRAKTVNGCIQELSIEIRRL